MMKADWQGTCTRLFAIDLRSLAVFRIAMALLVLFDLVTRARFAGLFYSDAGLAPRDLVAATFGQPSLYDLSGSPIFAGVLIAATAACAVALLVGWQTRWATLALWLLMGSLLNRNPWVVNGGDKLMRLLLFWSIFLPLGARASLDARRRHRGPETAVLSVASAVLLLQSGVLYVAAGLNKTGPMWDDGSAVFRSLSQTGHGRELGRLLYDFPQLGEWMTALIPPFELLAPLLLFSPFFTRRLRWLGIVVFAGFMIGLGLTLRLWLFPFVSCLALVPFVPGDLWGRFIGAWGSRDEGGEAPVPVSPAPVPASPAPVPASPARVSASPALMRGDPRASFVVAAAFVLSLVIGVMQHTTATLLPPGLHQLGLAAGLYQNWEMYADAGQDFASLETVAVRGDGTRVVIGPDHGVAEWEDALAFQDDFRGAAFLEHAAGIPSHQARYMHWLCGALAGDGPESPQRVVRLGLVLLQQPYLDEGGLGEAKRTPLSRMDCDKSRRAQAAGTTPAPARGPT